MLGLLKESERKMNSQSFINCGHYNISHHANNSMIIIIIFFCLFSEGSTDSTTTPTAQLRAMLLNTTSPTDVTTNKSNHAAAVILMGDTGTNSSCSSMSTCNILLYLWLLFMHLPFVIQ